VGYQTLSGECEKRYYVLDKELIESIPDIRQVLL
jgi:hypothetical protein